MPEMLSARNQAIVIERAAGSTLAQIGERHAMSHQAVSKIVAQANAQVDETERALRSARERDNECAFVVPYGPEYQLGMAFTTWVVDQLRRRGMQVRVAMRMADNGLAV